MLRVLYASLALLLGIVAAQAQQRTTPVVSGAAGNNLVVCTGGCGLYGAYAVNFTGTAGFLVVLSAAASPSDGAITPLDCVPLPANGLASINFNPGPAKFYSGGVVIVLTSAANCFTKTTGTITGYISGSAQ